METLAPSTMVVDELMKLEDIRELLSQVQHGARVTTAIGEPVQVGATTVISAAEVSFGGGGCGLKLGKSEHQRGPGAGGGMGVHIRPMGSWVITPTSTRWVPALDLNRALVIAGTLLTVLLLTLKVLIPHRR